MRRALDSSPSRTLGDLALTDANLADWWKGFKTMCPVLAAMASDIDVIDVGEAAKRAGCSDWVGETAATGGPEWVCFTGGTTSDVKGDRRAT